MDNALLFRSPIKTEHILLVTLYLVILVINSASKRDDEQATLVFVTSVQLFAELHPVLKTLQQLEDVAYM